MVKTEIANDDLADYVRRVRTSKGISLNDVANKARQKGKQISSGYVSQIENRYIVSVTTAKLQALAAGLDISEEEIFAVARGKTVSGDLQLNEMKLVSDFRTLPADKQDDVIAYVEMMRIRYGGEMGERYSDVGERPVYKAIAGIPKSLKGKKHKSKPPH